MKLTRQTYQTSTLADAIAAGCDIVQPKYSRLWCRVEVSRGTVRIYDDFREELHFADGVNESACCTLIGNYFGPPACPGIKVVVWDCWSLCQQPLDVVRLEENSLETFSYRDRFAFVKQQLHLLNLPWLTAVKNFPITAAPDLWDSPNAETCGLVFRRSRDAVGATLFVARKYEGMPGGLT